MHLNPKWSNEATIKPLSHATIDEINARRTRVSQATQSLLWAAINAFFALLFIIDIKCSVIANIFGYELFKYLAFIFDILMSIILCLNTIYDLYLYLWLVFWMKPIELNAIQMKLFGIKPNEIGFKEFVPKPQQNQSPIPKAMHSTPMFEINLSKHSSLDSTALSNNLNFSNSIATQHSPLDTTSTSWIYNRGSNTLLSNTAINSANVSENVPKTSFVRLRKSNASKANTSDTSINNESDLMKYLDDFEEREQRYEELLETEKRQVRNSASTAWNFSDNQLQSITDESVQKSGYQYAIDSPSRSNNSQFDAFYLAPSSPSSKAMDAILNKLNTDETKMNQWIENVRKWISQTILARFVQQIDKINDSLMKIGYVDSLIGEASLPSIKQIASLKKTQIPTLEVVVPYLEISVNQQYLVKRIRELAKGGCISDFIWNGGGFYNMKQWNEDLPTDSVIVMHMFCTYMDSCLPSSPNCAEGKSFTNQHFCSLSGQPPKNNIYILQDKINPPHYKVVTKDNEVWELPIGRNNLFHAVLVFLHCVKQKQFGLLGRINLGASGVNILWVVDNK